MVNFEELEIAGVYIIKNFVAYDSRGVFVKTFHSEVAAKFGYTSTFNECFYSQSFKNVFRGMHFQIPPYDLDKLVYVTSGKILDVVVDIRKNSPTYKKVVCKQLNEFENSMFVPRGCAHGFLTLSETATVVYNVTNVYNSESDKGLLWNSIGIEWMVNNPIVSDRDKSFPKIEDLPNYF